MSSYDHASAVCMCAQSRRNCVRRAHTGINVLDEGGVAQGQHVDDLRIGVKDLCGRQEDWGGEECVAIETLLIPVLLCVVAEEVHQSVETSCNPCNSCSVCASRLVEWQQGSAWLASRMLLSVGSAAVLQLRLYNPLLMPQSHNIPTCELLHTLARCQHI